MTQLIRRHSCHHTTTYLLKHQDILGDCVHSPKTKEHLDNGNACHFQLEGIFECKLCLHLQAAQEENKSEN